MGKEFILTAPTGGIRSKRPFLRSVDGETGTMIYVYLSETGKRIVKVNEWPAELADPPELITDILMARGLTEQQARAVVAQLQRTPAELGTFQVSQARRLDVRAMGHIPPSDQIAPGGQPLVLVPLVPSPGVVGIHGFLVTPEGATPLSQARFDLYAQLPEVSAAGLEEKRTPTAGLKALLEYAAQEDVISTIALLAESGKTGDVTGDFPTLGTLAKEAGFAEGVAAILRTVASDEAVIGVPAEYVAQGIPVFVKKEWEGRVRQNLSKLEATGRIRFVGSATEAYLVIGDGSVSVRPDQVFIAINEQTVSQVTPHLLQELQLSGLLKAGSVVLLYKPLKDSVLVFA